MSIGDKTQPLTAEQKNQQGALLKIVRDSTERFKDVHQAEREGYALQFGCVSGSDNGAMGLHYVNGELVSKGVLDATRPQIVIYEPTPDGGRKLIGADFLVFADVWDKTHPGNPPELMGSCFTCSTPEPFWTAGLLYAARLGMERKSERRLCELASGGFLGIVRRHNDELVRGLVDEGRA